jgi:hypothetical protein
MGYCTSFVIGVLVLATDSAEVEETFSPARVVSVVRLTPSQPIDNN